MAVSAPSTVIFWVGAPFFYLFRVQEDFRFLLTLWILKHLVSCYFLGPFFDWSGSIDNATVLSSINLRGSLGVL